MIRSCSLQHRKHPESPRPLAVAEQDIRGSPHRPPRIVPASATPLRRDHWKTVRAFRCVSPHRPTDGSGLRLPWSRSLRSRERPSPFQSARTAPDSNRHRTATAQQPQYLSPPQPRPGRAGPAPPRRATGLPRTRCSRAPTAQLRTPASRRATTAEEPPRATPGYHSWAGLKGAAAERDALRRKHRASERAQRVSWRGAQRAARPLSGWGFPGMLSGVTSADSRSYL